MHEEMEKELSEKLLDIEKIKEQLKDAKDELAEMIEKYAEAKGLEESDQSKLDVEK